LRELKRLKSRAPFASGVSVMILELIRLRE